MELKKLNLGCGADIKPGWINLDSAALPGVDVVHDIEKLPLPFPDEEFEEILAQDMLEHLTDYVPVLRDLHRILKKGGTLAIRVPHFTSKNNFIDPTHRRLFSVSTFDFFVKNSPLHKEREYYFDFAFERIALRRLTFEKSSRLFFYNRVTEWFFNLSPRLQTFYESTGFAREFPAENIVITLTK
jgi:SAM-dependent methyltransferase